MVPGRIWLAGLGLAFACCAAPDGAMAENRIGVGKAYSVAVTAPGGETVRVHAEDAGQGAPVVLLHGLGASTFTWRNIAPALARTHRVIALDLKGFGQSVKPFDLSYSMDEQAALVAAFLAARKLSGVTLIGHSLGGTVALRVALNHPARLSRLVLMSAPAYDVSIAPFVSLTLAPVIPETIISTLPAETLARIFLGQARGPGPVPEADVQGYASALVDLGTRHAILTTGRQLLLGGLDSSAARYREIGVATLVVWCRNDLVVPVETGRRLARDIPSAHLKLLSRCNHLPQDEQPARLLGVIAPFLKR